MTVWRLIIRETCHRKLNFGLGLLSVSVAVACVVGSMTLLKGGDIRTEQILNQKQQQVEKAGAELNDAMRRITKGLGFNVLILPKDQDLNELHAEGTLSKFMPEEYADRLANSRIVTINHLLPTITKKLRWPETGKTIILIGTRGEVPLAHRDRKKPLEQPVPPGAMVVGYELHRSLHLKVGDTVKLLGRSFTVTKLHPERGTRDDSTVWINLAEAQELLGKQNLINAILALECHCAGDRVTQIRQELARVLPGTQVIERGRAALARAEARQKAAEAAKQALRREAAARAALRRQRERFAAVLVPLVLVGCGLWIGLLAFGNVRERSTEIGLLRAIGLRSRDILTVFLGKAVLVGLAGAAVGYAAGFTLAAAAGDLPFELDSIGQLFAPGLLVLALVLAPVLAGLASWIPAMLAAQQDPAVVLAAE